MNNPLGEGDANMVGRELIPDRKVNLINGPKAIIGYIVNPGSHVKDNCIVGKIFQPNIGSGVF